MSDYELGISIGSLVVFSFHVVSCWLDFKYTKMTAKEYKEINNHLNDIKDKLESRG